MPEAYAIFYSEQAELDLDSLKKAEANIVISGIESAHYERLFIRGEEIKL